MSATGAHPINESSWWKVYGDPNSAAPSIGLITIEELGQWYEDDTMKLGKNFVVIDVRRADCEAIIPGAINLPAHSLPATLPSLLPMLSSIPILIFHCSSSKGRGPRAAGWVADMLSADGKPVKTQVMILKGGILAWEAKYGKGAIERRGQRWDGKSLETIQL